jgi:GTP cyclohydrolase II
VDSREWFDAIEIIKGLGLSDVTVMTNNPEKIAALVDAGIKTTVKSLDIQANRFNQKYLDTKATKLGHQRLGR